MSDYLSLNENTQRDFGPVYNQFKTVLEKLNEFKNSHNVSRIFETSLRRLDSNFYYYLKPWSELSRLSSEGKVPPQLKVESNLKRLRHDILSFVKVLDAEFPLQQIAVASGVLDENSLQTLLRNHFIQRLQNIVSLANEIPLETDISVKNLLVRELLDCVDRYAENEWVKQNTSSKNLETLKVYLSTLKNHNMDANNNLIHFFDETGTFKKETLHGKKMLELLKTNLQHLSDFITKNLLSNLKRNAGAAKLKGGILSVYMKKLENYAIYE